jgi:hypothetical protein
VQHDRKIDPKDFVIRYSPRRQSQAGLNSMTEQILRAYRIDIETRTNQEGNQRAIADGWKVNAHEVKPGVIYKDANVTVTAFATKPAMQSYGYRFDTPDRDIVISGDTTQPPNSSPHLRPKPKQSYWLSITP